VLGRIEVPTGMGNFLGLSGPLKSTGRLCCGVRLYGLLPGPFLLSYSVFVVWLNPYPGRIAWSMCLMSVCWSLG